MTDKILILVTASSRREGRKIARHLVESRLAACVNISQAIQSIYRWEGKLTEEREFLMLIKSTRELFPEIRKEILKIHSYTTPEIICLPVVDGSQAYLRWIGESVKQSTSAGAVLPGDEPEP
ncbi:MAG: divalent-cation tolerance protein CutA [Terriglobia bacterium]